ncbi:MAG TPA: M28 family peptidase [Gemmatimonadales bacterium]|nr:M28 family peptidase [Gemmatimonadales bacterium]
MARPRELLALLLDAPREAGTPAAAHARRLVADHLGALGFRVEEQTFAFHPSSLHALPMFGAGLGWLTLIQIPLATVQGAPAWGALVAWVGGLVALALLVRGTALGWSSLGGGVREDANLIATRGQAPVRRWIVAHLDTKAQGQSLAGRVVGIIVTALALLTLTVLAVLRLRGPLESDTVAYAAVLALAACGLAARGGLRGTSQGARDNGTGLLAALVAAEGAPPSGVGVLITGAEEFGLVGARVFAREFGPQLVGVEVVNLDTIDDRGALYVVSHDAAGARLGAALAAKAAAGHPAVRERRQPLWAFVDSQPLSRTGAAAVTLARLDWHTLRRVHTPRDTPTGMAFESAEAIGRLLAGPV